jgi:hypothetical protein
MNVLEAAHCENVMQVRDLLAINVTTSETVNLREIPDQVLQAVATPPIASIGDANHVFDGKSGSVIWAQEFNSRSDQRAVS